MSYIRKRNAAGDGMQEIEDIRGRLDAAPPVGDALVVALDAFGVLLAFASYGQDQSVELFPAFAFAAMAAAEGRNVVLTAPSLPDQGQVTSRERFVSGDVEGIADALAGLAGVLSAHLSAAARHARDPGDRAACEGAAAQARQVHALLTRDS
jgi:hypothetical protein